MIQNGAVPWDWKRIQREWLSPGRLAASPEEIVAAFNRVEAAFDTEWMEASRRQQGWQNTGPLPTLRIVIAGRLLASLEDLPGADQLMKRLSERRPSAWSELEAIYLLRGCESNAQIELEPDVAAGSHPRKADFRIRLENAEWTYVEVTRPDVSETEAKLREMQAAVTSTLISLSEEFALEIFLRREPTEEELHYILRRIPAIAGTNGTLQEELPDSLGRLLLNFTSPGVVVPAELPDEDVAPRLGFARVRRGGNEPTRHIAVRVTFTDERAEEFLRREARQLPNTSPGLIMIQMGPTLFRSWEPLLSRRLQPRLHTRVSAVCLFGGVIEPTDAGEDWRQHTRVIENEYAALPVADWILSCVRRSESVSPESGRS
jgi:hypothetical protein